MIRHRDFMGNVLTYSDTDFKIRKVGTTEVYQDAIDVPESGFVYEETDIPIEVLEVIEEV
jgi:hypothetical protein